MEKTIIIGKEAKELDEKNIAERMKLERNSVKKIFAALFIYILFMVIFYFYL